MSDKIKSKNRMLSFIVIGVLAIVGGVTYSVMSGSNNEEEVADTSKANNVQLDVGVGNIEVVPGKSVDPMVNALQEQKNQEDFNKAKQEGGSFIPKLVNDTVQKEEEIVVPVEESKVEAPVEEPKAPVEEPKIEMPVEEPKVEAPVEEPKVEQKPQLKIKYEVEMPVVKQPQDTTALEDIYKKEIEELMTSWKDKEEKEDLMSTEHNYYDNSNAQASNLKGGAQSDYGYDQIRKDENAKDGPVFVRSTTIVPGEIMTAINTDEPGPVLAQITVGPLKGARLLGEVTQAPTDVASNIQKATIQFSKIQLPNGDKEYAIDVYAIDLKTSRTALASSVDNHYFRRYGLGLAAAFIEGLGEAYSRVGTSITTNANSVVASTNPSTKEINRSALGKMGRKLSSEIEKISNVPATIYVNSGTPVGLLFMADF